MKGSRQDWGWGAKFLSENTRRRWERIEDGDQEDQDDKGGEKEGTEMRRRRRVSVAGDSLRREVAWPLCSSSTLPSLGLVKWEAKGGQKNVPYCLLAAWVRLEILCILVPNVL